MTARGFEFGHLRKHLFAHTSSIQFNNDMVDAKVFGCAYGHDTVAGFPIPVPALTIVGQEADKLVAASDILKEWGCVDDGDAIDIDIVLRSDGSYLLGVQPNISRGMYRMSTDQDLYDLVFFGGIWIKKIDTTNPLLWQWKDATRSRLFPVRIGFATAQTKFGFPQIETIKPIPGTITFVKLGLKISSEEENEHHVLLQIADGRKPPSDRPKAATPRLIAQRRQRVIDAAFPVSRDRIHRLKLHERLLNHLRTDNVSVAQVTQAAINVQLSREWSGLDHYPIDNFSAETWWERTLRRAELTTMPSTLGEVETPILARQLELDVAAVLRDHGAEVSSKFNINQRLFVRLGYGGD